MSRSPSSIHAFGTLADQPRSTVRNAVSKPPDQWRVHGAMWVIAGFVAGIAVLLDDSLARRDVLLGMAAGAVLYGVAAVALRNRLPGAGLVVSLIAGVVTASAALLVGGTPESGVTFVYVWTGVQAFFLLSTRSALTVLAAVACCYASTLLALTAIDGHTTSNWFTTIATIAVTSYMAAALRRQTERLVADLEDAARTDVLTGVGNRRGFDDALELEIERADRIGEPVSLVVFDLDRFKAVNDTAGHVGGDRALRELAELCLQQVRRVDVVARIGGDEFAVILPHSDGDAAHLLADRIRHTVRRDALGPAPGRLSTISVGVATYPHDASSAQALVHAADEALYAAKRLGRDRTVRYHADTIDAVRAGAAEDTGRREHLEAVLMLAETLDLRDASTASHCQTVGRYCALIAGELGLDHARVERIALAGRLHDVGKLAVPDEILFKPGSLTPEEFAEVQKHPQQGARILSAAGLDDISGWVLAHHERPDGRGYPFGLAGEAIPLEGRIVAVADAYEAMIADRVYRPGMPTADAVAELRRHAGAQFDASVVAAFLSALEREEPAAFACEALTESRRADSNR